jgi:hypothetical protein
VDEDDPTVSDDLLEMYVNSYRSGGEGSGDIWMFRRTNTAGPWGSLTNVAELNTTALDTTPRLHGNGLVMHFSNEVTASREIHRSIRTTRSAPWGTDVIVTELNSIAADLGAVMTTDQLSIYFTSNRRGNFDIYVATRSTVGALWGPPKLVPGLNTDFDEEDPFTRDGTTLYFHSNRGGSKLGSNIWVGTRPSVADTFGFNDVEPLEELNSDFNEEDPWLSPDGKTIWFTSTRTGDADIFVATR